MNLPQSGILPEASGHALFITLDLDQGQADIARAKTLLTSTPTLTEELSAQHPEAGLVSVVAIGTSASKALFGKNQPAEMADFQERSIGDRRAPATPADLLIHIRSERHDLNFELARRILSTIKDGLEIREEIHGFRYMDTRDLTGFVDGTENPEGDERAGAALVGDEDIEFAGGSYVLLQRYVHDLDRWNTMTQLDQEKTIGRTKDTDEELSEENKPESAHISRVVIKEDGEELEILRQSMPWGDSQRAGLVFVAYCRHRQIFDKMLDRMFDVSQTGLHDHLMDFTQAETGAYFFAPSLDTIAKL